MAKIVESVSEMPTAWFTMQTKKAEARASTIMVLGFMLFIGCISYFGFQAVEKHNASLATLQSECIAAGGSWENNTCRWLLEAKP